MLSSKSVSSAISVMLVTMLLCMAVFMPTAIGETTYPKREVKLLMLYDESSIAALKLYGVDSDNAPNYIEQAVKLAAAPFKDTWNIELDIEVLRYEDVLGIPYSQNECPGLWHWNPNDESVRRERVWHLEDGQCTCVPIEECYTYSGYDGHHNSALRLMHVAYVYSMNNPDYDLVSIAVGHKLCKYYPLNNTHSDLGGNGAINGGGSTVRIGQINDAGLGTLHNLLSLRGTILHELSHNYNLYDYYTGVPVGSNRCSINYPCTMFFGFNDVVYIKNAWCPKCQETFRYDSFGQVVGGAN